jgi:hypothetical protein
VSATSRHWEQSSGTTNDGGWTFLGQIPSLAESRDRGSGVLNSSLAARLWAPRILTLLPSICSGPFIAGTGRALTAYCRQELTIWCHEMTVYTIFAEGGRELAKVASLEEAATEMLTYDGHRFEIRQIKDLFRLFVSHRSANASQGGGRLIEWGAYAANTMEGVYRRVIANGGVKGTYAGEGL